MKTTIRRAGQEGSILMVTVTLSFIIGIVLLACLSLVKNQNQSVARSQAWNTCIPVIEAGIEEAMAHLNNKRESSLAVNGWTQTGSILFRERPFGDGFYSAVVDMTDFFRPTIICTGYVRLPAVVAMANQPLMASAVNVGGVSYISRTVQVLAKREPRWSKAMLAKDTISMSGNGIDTDSFDSSDPNYSTGGLWDPAKRKDNGDVATNSGFTNALGVGNANVRGRISTGPGGTVNIGPNGVVGSNPWHDGGNSGIEPGYSRDDMNIWIPDVEVPWTGGALPPISGVVTGATYTYLLAGGNYELATLTLKKDERIAVTAKSVLYVKGDLTMLGRIDIMPGATLELYVGGANAVIGGEGINNTGQATNFQYYGLPSNLYLDLPSNGDFTGAIYAPSVDLKLNSGGSSTLNFSGACVTRSIHLTGHYNFHYDEALRKAGPWKDYVIVSWVEL
jgi:hypothetical protein